MGKGTINWEDVETWKRVVAAIIATGVKLDLREMATYFGTTYDTLENRFRKIKKDAKTLQDEVNSGEREAATPSRTKSTPKSTPAKKTPKKEALSTVTNGRITKSTPKSQKESIKKEMLEEEAFSSTLDDLTTFSTGYSFDFGHTSDDGGEIN